MLELEVSFGSDTYLLFDKRRLTVAHNLLSKLGIVTFVLGKNITSRQNLSLIKKKINFLTVKKSNLEEKFQLKALLALGATPK